VETNVRELRQEPRCEGGCDAGKDDEELGKVGCVLRRVEGPQGAEDIEGDQIGCGEFREDLGEREAQLCVYRLEFGEELCVLTVFEEFQ
jgi:hypothetical protein